MKTITGKLMLSVSVLILFFIAMIYTANLLFIDDYFLWKTKNAFENELIFLQGIDGAFDTDMSSVIPSRSIETGMRYTISDPEGRIQLVSDSEIRKEKKTKISKGFETTIQGIGDSFFYGIIQRESSDKKDIILSAYLTPDKLIFITMPLEKLEENVRISNQFLLFIGSIVFFISLLISYFFSRKVVQPIQELTFLSEKISELDFTAKWSKNRSDEIGNLGASLNATSVKLKNFIENLKKEMALQARFTASVSHELKSPVGLIRGYAEALSMAVETKENDKDEENDIKEYAEIILSESDRLALLINDLLLLLQLNSTSFKMDKSEFDLVKMIRIIIKKYSLLIQEKLIQFQLETPESLSLYGDEKRLTQAIENVLNNAIKHCTQEGLIRIRISEESGSIILSIANKGSQIAEHHLPYLFDPFYSAHEGRSRDTTGSGLGLSIVRSILEKHDGRCSIHNIEDGVQFVIELK